MQGKSEGGSYFGKDFLASSSILPDSHAALLADWHRCPLVTLHSQYLPLAQQAQVGPSRPPRSTARQAIRLLQQDIDLPGGKQPMTTVTADGSVTLAYSGECYNYTELRAELRSRGHRFRTESDTEAVLLGYLEWGAGVMKRLNGMYAFAIWDERDDHLLLARDRMGVKPLYYYPTEDGVLFGSEPKAILSSQVAEQVVDLDGLREMFGLVNTPGHAMWRGMLEVAPGTMVSADRSGCRSLVYWRLSATPHADDGATPMHAAAYAGRPDLVRRLAERGADVDARDSRRDATPVEWAIVGSQERPAYNPGAETCTYTAAGYAGVSGYAPNPGDWTVTITRPTDPSPIVIHGFGGTQLYACGTVRPGDHVVVTTKPGASAGAGNPLGTCF